MSRAVGGQNAIKSCHLSSNLFLPLVFIIQSNHLSSNRNATSPFFSFTRASRRQAARATRSPPPTSPSSRGSSACRARLSCRGKRNCRHVVRAMINAAYTVVTKQPSQGLRFGGPLPDNAVLGHERADGGDAGWRLRGEYRCYRRERGAQGVFGHHVSFFGYSYPFCVSSARQKK